MPLWAAGPGELLQFGIGLSQSENDAKRRIALILIDNAVELIFQTYLTLPRRVTGLDLSRRQREECCAGFPSMLDGIEAHAADKIVGLNLGEFEWFHRIRNQLYHEGNGLTVEHRHLQVYSKLAIKLFEALFGIPLELDVEEDDTTRLIGQFFESWIQVERRLSQLVPGGEKMPLMAIAARLQESGDLSRADVDDIKRVQMIRNQLVHGEAEPEEMLRQENMALLQKVQDLVSIVWRRRMVRRRPGT
jgi:hypothetical protein